MPSAAGTARSLRCSTERPRRRAKRSGTRRRRGTGLPEFPRRDLGRLGYGARNENRPGFSAENVTKRHSEEWLRLWLSDPQGTWKSDHPETRELKERTRKAKAPATSCVKKPMDEAQTRDLFDYLKTLETE